MPVSRLPPHSAKWPLYSGRCWDRRGHPQLDSGTVDRGYPGWGKSFGVLLAVIVGVPMYADIFGTIPVAEALLGKGAQLGTVLAFMMAVTTLSLPSIIMLRKAVKPKLLGIFVGICAGGILAVGYLFNALEYLLI